MSNGEDLFALREDMASRPSFELALRGYDKRQVDRYLMHSASFLKGSTRTCGVVCGPVVPGVPRSRVWRGC
jgi:hypothetical protein